MFKHKRKLIAFVIVLTLVFSFSATCFAADISTSADSQNIVLLMNDHGATTINLSWSLTESYNAYEKKEIFVFNNWFMHDFVCINI